MTFTAQIHTETETASFSTSHTMPVPSEVVATAQPFPETPTAIAELQQQFFGFGSMILRLEQKPKIAVYAQKQRFEIVDWGINLRFGDQGEIAREMARKFLALFGKAERDELSDAERSEWTRIVQSVDYQKFCAERSPFRYMEGELEKTQARVFVVKWHDGSSVVIDRSTAPELRVLNIRERFSALVKFGEGDKVMALQSVSILPPIRNAEETWKSWPVRNS